MSTLSWILRISLGVLLLAAVSLGGCQCSATECATKEDCPFPTTCLSNKCVPVGAETTAESAQEAKSEPAAQEPATEQEPVSMEEPTSGPEKEPNPSEPVVEEEPVSTEDGGDLPEEPTVLPEETTSETLPEAPPEGINKDLPTQVCKDPTGCPQGLYCIQGSCQNQPQCSSDVDCSQTPYTRCVQGYCTLPQPACQATGQCVPGSVCINGQCLPGGIPSTCKNNSECPGTFLCTNGSCQRKGIAPKPCQTNSQCSSWEICVWNICQRKCNTPNDCQSVSLPSCNGGVCITPNLPPGNCNADSDCMPRQYCSGSTCITCQAPPDCAKDADCKSGEVCRNGQCGKTCTSDASCSGGFQICSQGFCRGDGYKPVGCPEDQEICDLVIDKITCLGNGRMEVTVKNIGIGPATGRFYLCYEQKGSKKGCNGAIIMNYFSTGGIIPSNGTDKVTVSWKVQQGDTITVDRPDLILEANDQNNSRTIQAPCP